MSDIDGLLEELTGPERPDQGRNGSANSVFDRWGRPILILASFGALALLGLAAFVGYQLASGDSETTATADSTPTASSVAPEGEGAAAGGDADSDAETGTAAATDPGTGDAENGDGALPSATDSDAPGSDDGAPTEEELEAWTAELGVPSEDNPDGAVSWVRVKDRTVYLRGFAPSQDWIDQVVELNIAIWGEGNVVDEYRVLPTIPPDSPISVYIDDVVFFEFNSIDIDPEFFWLLDNGATFLKTDPEAHIVVIGHADSVGDPETNLRIATQRAEAVIDYYISQGADPSQVTAIGRGEEDASEADGDEGNPDDRRVEFFVGDPSTID